MPLPSPILYANPSLTTILIDLPLSISAAQGPGSTRILRATAPLGEPYQVPEPRGGKADVVGGEEEEYHTRVREAVEEGLREIARGVGGGGGAWCLPRREVSSGVVLEEGGRGGKRKRGAEPEPGPEGRAHSAEDKPIHNEEEEEQAPTKKEPNLKTYTPNLTLLTHFSLSPLPSTPFPLLLSPSPTSLSLSLCDIYTTPLHNPSSTTSIPLPLLLLGRQETYHIPPHSTLTLGPLPPHHPPSPPLKKCKIIILDPPWPNRSARRSGAYKTSTSISTLLLSLPGYFPLSEGGVVGIWTTNRAAHRRTAKEVLNLWGATSTEEWVWIKTTTSGAPIFPLSSTWRKPYEILLLARKNPPPPLPPSPPPHPHTHQNSGREVTKRIIASVPSFHSQKPWVGELVEEVFGVGGSEEGEGGRKVEIFARGLVAGWEGWGDEVLKFCWGGWWVGCDGDDDGRGGGDGEEEGGKMGGEEDL